MNQYQPSLRDQKVNMPSLPSLFGFIQIVHLWRIDYWMERIASWVKTKVMGIIVWLSKFCQFLYSLLSGPQGDTGSSSDKGISSQHLDEQYLDSSMKPRSNIQRGIEAWCFSTWASYNWTAHNNKRQANDISYSLKHLRFVTLLLFRCQKTLESCWKQKQCGHKQRENLSEPEREGYNHTTGLQLPENCRREGFLGWGGLASEFREGNGGWETEATIEGK